MASPGFPVIMRYPRFCLEYFVNSINRLIILFVYEKGVGSYRISHDGRGVIKTEKKSRSEYFEFLLLHDRRPVATGLCFA